MKSKEFIEAKLNELYKQFCNIKIQYEYRANTYSHLIKVIPLNFFKENKEYIILETKIEDEFETLFPDENIVFISEDSLSEIYNPDFKLGYESITFDNEVLNIDFIVNGFSESIDFQTSDNYALAA